MENTVHRILDVIQICDGQVLELAVEPDCSHAKVGLWASKLRQDMIDHQGLNHAHKVRVGSELIDQVAHQVHYGFFDSPVDALAAPLRLRHLYRVLIQVLHAKLEEFMEEDRLGVILLCFEAY